MDFWRSNPPLIYGMWMKEARVHPDAYLHSDAIPPDLRARLDEIVESEELRSWMAFFKRARRRFQAGPDMLDGRDWSDFVQNMSRELTNLCVEHRIPLAVMGVLWRWIWSPARTVYECVPKDFFRHGLVGAEKFLNECDGLYPSPNIAWDRRPTQMLVVRVDVNASQEELWAAFTKGRASIMPPGEAWGKGGAGTTQQDWASIIVRELAEELEDGQRPEWVKPPRWTSVRHDFSLYLRTGAVSGTLARYTADEYARRFPLTEAQLSDSTVRAALKRDHKQFAVLFRHLAGEDEAASSPPESRRI